MQQNAVNKKRFLQKNNSCIYEWNFFLLFGVFFIALLIGIVRYGMTDKYVVDADRLSVGEQVFMIEIADDVAERTQGLSGREFLPNNTGLLFVFEKSGIQRFWMKDMNFPIDIIWIDESLRVVDVTRNAQPDSFPQTFSPTEPVLYVLEVNAGDAEYIEIGDQVSF